MPSKPRPGVRPIYVELPEALADGLQQLAERNRRKIKAEVVLAVEAHLAANLPPEASGRPRKAAETTEPPAAKPAKGKKKK